MNRLFRRNVFLILLIGIPTLAMATDGLHPGNGAQWVTTHCGACHSLMLVTQNRADRKGWLAMIRWMQEEHGLWPLGEQEDAILDYLATYYSKTGTTTVARRRAPLAPALLPAH